MNKKFNKIILLLFIALIVLFSVVFTGIYKKQAFDNKFKNQQKYLVNEVIDGDTIRIKNNESIETIRLIGINTPETKHPTKPQECFGNEASEKAKSILTNQYVELESDPTQSDKDIYDRLLRYVFLKDGTNFNKMMIEEGFAFEYTFEQPYKYQQEFKDAESEAKNNYKGLWSESTCNGELKPITD